MKSKTNNTIKETMRKTKALINDVIFLILVIILIPFIFIAFWCYVLVYPAVEYWRDL